MNSDLLYSIFLGAVQGITEFLPISSSGHLVILQKLINSPLLANLTFDVILHAGTLVALIAYFFKDLIALLRGFFRTFIKLNLGRDPNQRLSWFIIIATIPVALVGYFFGDWLENYFRNPLSVAVSLIVVGILFIAVERSVKPLRNMEVINLGDIFFIGLAQVFSLIPGVSRSGITIIAGMSKKLTRDSSARFAFLLAIPAILGATVKQLVGLNFSELLNETGLVYLVGFVASVVAGLFSLRFLMNFLRNHTLTGFAIYRFILAAVIIAVLVL